MKKYLHIMIALTLILGFGLNQQLKAQDVSEEKEAQFNIYPNPMISGQEVTVVLEMVEIGKIVFHVYDFAGKLVLESTNDSFSYENGIYKQEIKIEAKGLYFMKCVVKDEQDLVLSSKVKKLYVI
jgi:hypothetical protein